MCYVGILRPHISDNDAILYVLYDTTVVNASNVIFAEKKNISKFRKYLTNEGGMDKYILFRHTGSLY